ncbi:MAG: phosphonate metabolism protein/1,5-bisphosphokinase (PRPP-forming) PhnN [Rhodomicrobiaceae bacterium]
MPEPSTELSARGAGKLILVVGPSGSGKDTLIEAARRHFEGEETIVFCRRCITRADQKGEAHEFVSDNEFERMKADGAFFLSWDAHGLHYGVSASIRDNLMGGRNVVVNVSRSVIAEARRQWPDTHVINIWARPEVLRQRLEARGREAAENIGKRLERAGDVALPDAEWVHQIDNSGSIASGSARFLALIGGIVSA